MSPVAFLQQPPRWLRGDLALPRRRPAAARTSPTTCACARCAPGGARRGSTCPRWQVAFNGAEPVRAETLRPLRRGLRALRLPARGVLSLLRPGRGDAVRLRRRAGASRAVRGRRGGPGADGGRGGSEAARASWSAAAGLAEQSSRSSTPRPARRARRARSARSGSPGRASPRGYWKPPGGDGARPSAPRLADGSGPFLRTGDLGFLARRRAVRHRPAQGPDHPARPQPLPAGHRADRRARAIRRCARAAARPSPSRSTARSGW